MNPKYPNSSGGSRRPRLVSVAALLCFGVAFPLAATEVVFREVAEAVGLDFVHFNGMIGKLYFPEVMGAGVAVLDYDGDGDLDIWCGQGDLLEGDRVEQAIFPPKYPFPQRDRLYRNDLTVDDDGRRTMRFTDVTEQAGLPVGGHNMGVAAADYDNDGDVDLYVTNLESNFLARNNGDGTFTDVTREAGADDPGWSVAATFFDYDRDGWLDLFVGNYTEFRKNLHKDCHNATGLIGYCGPLSYAALPNRLLRNRGDGTFEDVSTSALGDNPVGTTLGTVAGDFNDDGWLDVYVANDQLANQLWLNQRDGTFIDDALLSGAAVDAKGQPQASMGVVAADLDGDGHEDLFMSHLRMEMNTLYLNDGTGLFTDRSNDSGLGMASWKFTGFGTAVLDYDNDGWVDVYIANGAVKHIEEQARAGEPHPLLESNLLFRGLGAGRYEEVPDANRVDVVHSEVSRGVAAGDLDNDGDTDLVVSNNAGPVRLLVNQMGSEQPWLGLRLLPRDLQRDALGAKVTLRRQGAPALYRRVRTDGSYGAAGDARVLFGLGNGAQIQGIEVRWPDGTEESFSPDAAPLRAYSILRQGEGRGAEE